jgi:hypothetical protein
LAFIASFFVLGTWPAEIVSKRVQSWVITTATVLVTLGVLFWICWLRRFRFTLRAVFKLTFCFSVLFAVLAWLRTRTHAFDMFPPELWVPAKHFDLWADVLGVQYGAAKHSWGAAAVQWLGYCGPFVTGWLGLGLVGTWCAARAAIVARKAGASTNTLSSRAFWSDCFASAGRWSWAPGLACLVVYLSIAPRYFQSADSHHVSVIGNLRNPWPEWQAIQKALAQLSTDNQRDPENGVD